MGVRVASMAALCLYVLLTGCMAAHEDGAADGLSASRIIPETVQVSSYAEEEAVHRLRDLLKRKAAPNEVRQHAETLLSQNSPYLSCVVMRELSTWNHGSENRTIARNLMFECLSNRDGLIRCVGLMAAARIESGGTLCGLCRKHLAALWVRPDPMLAGRLNDPENITFRSLDRAGFVALARAEVIRTVALCSLSEALPVLQAIRSDQHEWHQETKVAATEALTKLARGLPVQKRHPVNE